MSLRGGLALALALGLGIGGTVAAQESARLVTTRPLADVVMYPRESAPATVVSVNESRLSAEIRASVTAITVRVGEVVEQDQVLLKLDCRQHQLGLRQAEAAMAGVAARLDLAQGQLERARSLSASANISQEILHQRRAELNAVEAELAAAKAMRERAALDVEHCTVRAPFEGVVLGRLANIGELADVGTPLLHLLDRGRLEISAQVTLDQVEGLTTVDNARFVSGGRDYPVKLRLISPAINPQARNREARLLFVAERALPGAAGRLVWNETSPHLPAELLVRRDDRLGVFVVNGGAAHFVVLPDALEGRPAPVSLPADSWVVIEGRQILRDGDRVSTSR